MCSIINGCVSQLHTVSVFSASSPLAAAVTLFLLKRSRQTLFNHIHIEQVASGAICKYMHPFTVSTSLFQTTATTHNAVHPRSPSAQEAKPPNNSPQSPPAWWVMKWMNFLHLMADINSVLQDNIVLRWLILPLSVSSWPESFLHYLVCCFRKTILISTAVGMMTTM